MAIEIIGADTSDPGPRGVIARFIEASSAKDANVDAVRAMLTEGSREGFDIDAAAFKEATVRIGEVESEEDWFVVPTALEDEEGTNEMPFVVREEGGELRIDFDATLGKLMGVSPEELMEEMAESMGSALGTVMEGVGDALAEGFAAMGAEVADATEAAALDAIAPEDAVLEEGEWHLPPTSAEDFKNRIIETASALGSMFVPAFMPFPELLDSEEWAPEGSKIVTTRYGDEKTGFTCVDTLVTMEAMETHILDVTAYGMPEGQALRLVWSRYAVEDQPPTETAHVQATAPRKTHRFIGGQLRFDFGWEDPEAGDDG